MEDGSGSTSCADRTPPTVADVCVQPSVGLDARHCWLRVSLDPTHAKHHFTNDRQHQEKQHGPNKLVALHKMGKGKGKWFTQSQPIQAATTTANPKRRLVR